MAAIAKRAPRVRGVAAFVVAYPLAHDLLDFLLGRSRAGYYGCQRWRRGPASLGGALLRYGRRAPACAWRWSTPAARARRCSLATPRPRARPSPFARPIVTRARHTAVWSPVHARALTSHTRLTPFGSCRTDALLLRSDHKCPNWRRRHTCPQKVESALAASGCKDTSKAGIQQ